MFVKHTIEFLQVSNMSLNARWKRVYYVPCTFLHTLLFASKKLESKLLKVGIFK